VNQSPRPALATLGFVALLLAVAAFQPAVAAGRFGPQAHRTTSPIQHVVVIVMENRTVDDLFAGFYGQWPGLDIANPNGNPTLRQISLSTAWDPLHDHKTAFTTEFAGGKQNGWTSESFGCPGSGCDPNPTVLAYVNPTEVALYRSMAQNFAIADEVFQPNEGPSFPAHQYLIAGESGGLHELHGKLAEAENPVGGRKQTQDGDAGDSEPYGTIGGCDKPTAKEQYIDMTSSYPGIEARAMKYQPCENYPTIFDLLDKSLPGSRASHWTYVMPAVNSIWSAPIGVKHLYDAYVRGARNVTVDADGQQFVANVRKGTLPAVSYVIPCFSESDHADSLSTTGPHWVSWVANAVGESGFWNSTAVVVVWDDWGGWYDHVQTGHPLENPWGNPDSPYEWGFRVPMIVMSPYVKQRGFIDHTKRSYSSILDFIESTYGLPSLGADDAYLNDNLSGMFNFSQKPLPWVPLNTGSFKPPKRCPKL